jgi:tetratricopeptide (TPR) repeat protein
MKTLRILITVGLTLVFIPFFVSAQSGSIEDGKRLLEQKYYKAAKTVFEELTESDSKNHEAFHYLGRSLFELEEYEKSVNALEKSIKIHPTSSDYHVWLGDALAYRAREVNKLSMIMIAGKMKKSYEKAVELDPDNVDARWGLMQYLLAAPAIGGGSKEKAKEQAQEIMRLDKNRGHEALLLVYANEKNLDSLEKQALEAIAFNEKNITFKVYLSYAYHARSEYDKAFDFCEKTLIEVSDKAPFLYQIGRVSALSGERLDRGIECLKMYLNSELETTSITPGKDMAYWDMGRIYEHKNDIESATTAYERALKINPNFEYAKKALKKIRK